MTAVCLEHVTKLYDLHAGQRGLISLIKSFRGKKHDDGFFRALTDVSFEVRKGETLGIVGRNGSGKSTILKIIAGITRPTSGVVSVNGKVTSMIELGAGFHPDLTGRENVYLNGAMLGLSRKYVASKFEEIVEFAELKEFIDVPVKKYSSGMHARLGFAVSSIVDPDILIIDEVLAVGDEAFQRKCYAKISQLHEQGVSIILVSHAAAMVVELCDRAMLMHEGETLLIGNPKVVVSKYHQFLFTRPEARNEMRQVLKAFKATDETEHIGGETDGVKQIQMSSTSGVEEFFDESLIPKSKFSYGEGNKYGISIQDPRIVTAGGRKVNNLILGRTYSLIYEVSFDQPASGVRFGILIKTITGYELGGGVTSHPEEAVPAISAGSVAQVRFDFKCMLRPGAAYFVNAGVIGVGEGAELYLDRIVDAVAFRVLPERNLLGGGVVDFGLQPSYSITNPAMRASNPGSASKL